MGAPSGARSLAVSLSPPLARDARASWGLWGGGLLGEVAGGASILEAFVQGFATRMGVLYPEPFASPGGRWTQPTLQMAAQRTQVTSLVSEPS